MDELQSLLIEMREWLAGEVEAGDTSLRSWLDRIDRTLETHAPMTAGEITRALNATRQNGDLVSENDVARAMKVAAAVREP